jgi:hypothetical protein
MKINIDRDTVLDVQTRILTLLDRKNGEWAGSMTELSTALTSGIRRSTPNYWPTNPSTVRRVLNTVAPTLRRSGVRVVFGRETNHFRKRFVRLERV